MTITFYIMDILLRMLFLQVDDVCSTNLYVKHVIFFIDEENSKMYWYGYNQYKLNQRNKYLYLDL